MFFVLDPNNLYKLDFDNLKQMDIIIHNNSTENIKNMKFIATILIALFASSSVIGQKYEGTVKENPLKKTEKAVPVQMYETQKAGKDQVVVVDSEKSDDMVPKETYLHKLQMCESRIAHNSTEELSKKYEVLRKDFVDFVKNSDINELSAPEKTKYMSLMKQEANMEEYARAKNSLRKK